jgi:glycosyltransferase involved in cell wall biosynthesis
MNISGATIIRNGVKLGYPFIESIRSILPFCREVVIGVGDSDDDTRKKIEAIGDKKIRVIDTIWDMQQRTGGLILSQQTNRVLPECTGDWIFYIQGDEVADSRELKAVEDAVHYAENHSDIDGIAFRYNHFYGSYYTVQKGRNWYGSEVRIIRNGRGIVSHGDAQGFRKDGEKIRAVLSKATMYHYGWARPPEVMAQKVKSFHQFWHDDGWIQKNCGELSVQEYFQDLGNIAPFAGTHPPAMEATVNRDAEGFILQCLRHYREKRSVKETLRDLFRKLPLGRHRNYRLVKQI